MVTEGVVHGVYKVLARLSFGVTRQHKASGVNEHFATMSQGHIRTLDSG